MKNKIKKPIAITFLLLIIIYLFDYREAFIDGILLGLK
ncbi:hypothetical protein SAMN04489761_3241 [Tenacibaculum sp. MAR_2009_124]|nr:hypothetical protein SAMN04489761_3241 [Tenacibaculum sp. MAR_2009_124]